MFKWMKTFFKKLYYKKKYFNEAEWVGQPINLPLQKSSKSHLCGIWTLTNRHLTKQH